MEANFQVYGVRKVWRQLQREAIAAPRCQVARLMKRTGLAGTVRGKTVKTTHSDKPCPLDRVNRQFRAPAPGERLYGNDVVVPFPGRGRPAETDIAEEPEDAEAEAE